MTCIICDGWLILIRVKETTCFCFKTEPIASLTWWNFFTSSDQNVLCASTHQSADELAQVSVQKQGYAATDLKGDFNGTAECVDSWFLSTGKTRKVNLLLLLDKWMEIFVTAMMLWCSSLRLKYLKLQYCAAVLSRLDHAEKPLLTNKCTAWENVSLLTILLKVQEFLLFKGWNGNG